MKNNCAKNVINIQRGNISVGESKKKRARTTLKRRYTKKYQRYNLGANLERNGFVKLYKDIPLKLQKSPLLRGTWMAILISAPWTKREVNMDGNIITLKPGQFVFSSRDFSASWGIPHRTFYDHIKQLQTLKLLTVAHCAQSRTTIGPSHTTLKHPPHNNYMVLSVCNSEEIYNNQKPLPHNFDAPPTQQLEPPTQQCVDPIDFVKEKTPLRYEEEEKIDILCLNKSKHESETAQESPPKDPIKPASSQTKAAPRRRSKKDYPEFNEIFKEYPERDGSHGVLKTLVDKVTKITNKGRLEELKSAITNYREYCIDKDKEGTEYVMQFCTFLTSRTKGWEAWINPNGDQLNSSPSKEMTYEENFRYGHITGAF